LAKRKVMLVKNKFVKRWRQSVEESDAFLPFVKDAKSTGEAKSVCWSFCHASRWPFE
jgi:hypothetical protein